MGICPIQVITALDQIEITLNETRSTAKIKMVPIAIGKSFSLRNVLFDLDKSSLLPESEKELGYLLVTLKDNPRLRATIIGHTDNQGSKFTIKN